MDALAQAIHDIETRTQAELAREFTKLAYGALAPANNQPWNRDGFYTARSAEDLQAHGFVLPQLEQDFPVPADCPYWSAPFKEGQLVLRGFLRHAWLPLPDGSSGSIVAIPVRDPHHALSVSIGNIPLEPLGKTVSGTSLLLWTRGEAPAAGMLHMRSESPVAMTPHGRISCSVGKPFWFR